MEGLYVVECREGCYLVERSTSYHNRNIHPLQQTSEGRGLAIDYIVIYDAVVNNDEREISHINLVIETRDESLRFDDLVMRLNGPLSNRNYIPDTTSPSHIRHKLQESGLITSVIVEYKLIGDSKYTKSTNYRFYLREDDIDKNKDYQQQSSWCVVM
jgi:hypothetical protein